MGGLYKMLESDKWWFELLTLFTKMILTGALGIFMPGSPIQIFLALIVCEIYALVLLRTTPYIDDAADVLKFSSTIVMIFTFLGGLVLMMDQESAYFDASALDFVIVFMNISVLLAHIGYIAYLLGKRKYKPNSLLEKQGSTARNSRKVVPAAFNKPLQSSQYAEEAEKLRTWK